MQWKKLLTVTPAAQVRIAQGGSIFARSCAAHACVGRGSWSGSRGRRARFMERFTRAVQGAVHAAHGRFGAFLAYPARIEAYRGVPETVSARQTD